MPFSVWVRGWRDGREYDEQAQISQSSMVPGLDRWTIQNADCVTLKFQQPSKLCEIKILQDPHSSELGGYLWTSSVLLCFYLESKFTIDYSSSIVPTKKRSKVSKDTLKKAFSFIELGAGVTGVPSIALATLGHSVVATDISELVPQLAKNLEINDLGENAQAQTLEWKNWNGWITQDSNPMHFNADKIVMADCIYSEASASSLVDTIAYLVKQSPSIDEVICVSEQRNEQAQAEFRRLAEPWFELEMVAPEMWQQTCPEELRADYLNLYLLRPKLDEISKR